MTVRGPALIISGSSMPTSHQGWNGITQMIPDALIDSLEMLHLFGTDFNPVFPASDTTSAKSTGDHSWNGRHLTKFGSAAPGTKSIVLGVSDYYLSPLTGAALKAISGSFSQFVVAKFTNTGAGVMGSWNTDANDGFLMGRDVGTSTRYQTRTSFSSGSFTDKNTPVIATDADTGTVYEILALSYSSALSSVLYRQKPGGSLQSQTVAIDAVPGGAQLICIGRTYPAANYTAAVEVVAAGAFSSALDSTAMASLQDKIKTFLADYSITI